MTARPALLLAAASATLALVAPAGAGGASGQAPRAALIDTATVRAYLRAQRRERTAYFDARREPATKMLAAAVRPELVLARRDLLARLGRFGVAAIDRLTGTPRVVARLDGFLSAPRRGDPAAVVLAWARSHPALMGLGARDLAGLRLRRRYRSPDGVTHLIWAQTAGGIPAFDNELRASVARDGRIVNVGGSPRSRLRAPRRAPAVSAAAALTAVLRSVDSPRPAPRLVRTARGAIRRTEFAGGDHASLVLFGDARGTRLAWRVWVTASSREVYDAVVDARTGRLLWRANRVHSASVLAFDFYPGAPSGGIAKPRDVSAFLSAPNRLQGNNTHTFTDVMDDNRPGAGDEVPPSAGSDWLYPYAPVLSPLGNCPEAGCSWNHLIPFSWQINLRQNAQQVFYFINAFHDHLQAPPISFTEAAGNFQAANRSGQGKGGDAVQAHTSDGANSLVVGLPDIFHVDNANMLTPPDGTPPRMQMYLFEPLPPPFGAEGTGYPFSDVNGGDDGSIIYHEYTHGLSNRLIVDAAGSGAVSAPQSGAMGEAWSDWYAADFLAGQGFYTDTPAPGEIKVGPFTDGGNNLIRTEPLDCPVGAPASACPRNGAAEGLERSGGYTYGQYGQIIGSPEVHADGEIWAQTLWDLRQRLIADHGPGPGVTRARELVTRAMSLSPTNPSFLDMRNAILQTDTVTGGADRAAIWEVFAGRGMGFFAAAADGTDVAPTESFALPPAAGAATGSVTGTLSNAQTGAPLVAVPAGLGGHFSGLPGDLGTFTGLDGRFTIENVPAARYPLLMLGGAGYDRFPRAGILVAPGGTAGPFDAKLDRDWAAPAGGARIVATRTKDVGCGVGQAVDQLQGTAWSALAPGNPDDPGPKSFTVELPAAVDVTKFQVDPAAGCYDDLTASTGEYRIETSTDGRAFVEAASGTFASEDNRRLNDIAPAPNAARAVRFVRFTGLSNQGPLAEPGGTGFREYMDLSELIVLGRAADTSPPTISFPALPRRGLVRGDIATVKGTASDEQRLALVLVNGIRATLSGAAWQARIPLNRRGRTTVRAIAVDGAGNGAQALRTATADVAAPRLRVLAPRRGRARAGTRVTVSGTARDEHGIARVLVGSRRARLRGSRFSLRVRLSRRARSIVVTAEDRAGRRIRVRVPLRRARPRR